MRNLHVVLVAFALGALWMLDTHTACADAAHRVIVLPFEGPRAEITQRAVEGVLEQLGYEVVRPPEHESAEAGALASVSGEVEVRRRRARATIRIVEMRAGRVVAELRFSARSARQLAEVLEGSGERFGSALSAIGSPGANQVHAEVSETSEVSEEPEAAEMVMGDAARDATSPETASNDDPPHALVLSLGGGVMSRELGYRDDLFAQLVGYSLPAAPILHASLRWYPGAHFTRDALAHVGVTAEFGSIVGVRSRQGSGGSFPTESLRFEVGVEARLPIAPVELALGFAYGMHTFSLADDEAGNSAPIPNVNYKYLRPALRGRVDIGVGLYLDATFGWRFLVGVGALGSWFPRNQGSGFDLSAGLGWESEIGLGVRLGFQLHRYFFSLRPEPGDALIAGGAADQTLTGTVDVVWRIR